MGHITVTEKVGAPVEAVFAYVDDHRNTTRYMKDLTRWEPAGTVTHGKGARFAVAMKAGPMTLSSVVDINVWTENRAIGWTSREGFKQTGKWSFASAGDGSEATFDLEYELPGGIAGRVLSRAADPIVRSNIQQSVKALKHQVEAVTRKAAARVRSASKVASRTAPVPKSSKRAAAKKSRTTG
jgi:uncharacterized membrane protein